MYSYMTLFYRINIYLSIYLPSFKEIHYFFRHCRHMARQRVCVTRCFDFSTAFTVDLLKHLSDQDRDLVWDEISNSQLFSSAFIFNSQNWISTRILRVCKHEFRALIVFLIQLPWPMVILVDIYMYIDIYIDSIILTYGIQRRYTFCFRK